MFTGIIEELGRVVSLEPAAGGMRIRITASLVTSDISEGHSIAVNGVCLTAIDASPEGFSADVSPETLERTTLDTLKPGAPVNLERAVTPTTRLGGHIVQGHVDARGTIVSIVPVGEFWTVRIGYPPELGRYFIQKGSLAIEGISLTIAALTDTDLDIAVIPKTWKMTNLSTLNPGDPVNLEVDPIARYVERLMTPGGANVPLSAPR